jgi:tripartite-type tricarboxylate transporter receptor subunit TctC
LPPYDQQTTPAKQVRGKRIKAYAVAAPQRNAALPDVPTTGEGGLPDYEVSVWTGLFGPAGVPTPIVDKLNAALSNALSEESVRQRLLALGGEVPEPAQRTPWHLAELVANEIARWTAVGAMAGFVPK